MRKLVAFTIATTMSVSALAGPGSLLRCFAKPADIQRAAKSAFVKVETREGMKGVFARYIGVNGKVIAEHQIMRRTPKDMLLKYAPSKIRAAMSKKNIGGIIEKAGKISSDAVMRFPEEAAAFFFAIGAITYGQSVFDYNSNPVAVSQYLNSQKDPIGQVAFLNFMIANGLASHAMTHTFKSPSFRPFIPYFGMSIGMTASNITHEMAHLPHIKECIASIKAGKEDESCDKAYSSWTDFGYEKAHEYAPTFMSMWASSLLSGVVSQCISLGVHWTAAQVAKVIGVQLLMTITPSGWVARAGHFVIKVGQLGMFVGLDMLINPYITKPYRMTMESYDLAKVEEDLFMSLKEHKTQGWKKSTEHNLNEVLKDLDVQMTQWRNVNMQKVQMAHANWMEFLSNLTKQYQAARDYYSHFTGKVWEKSYGPYANKGYVNIIDRTMPLNGVTPNNLNPEALSTFVDSPDEIKTKQLETVAIVVERMKDMLKADKVRKHMTDDDIVAYNEIRSGLTVKDYSNVSDKELDRIGDTLTKLKFISEGGQYCQKSMIAKCDQFSPAIRGILSVVYKLLGQPQPQVKPGQGYATALKLHPEFGPLQLTFNFKGREQSYRHLVTPDNPSFLTASMMYGAPVNSNLIKVKHSFPAEFYPPRISAENNTDLSGSVMFGVAVHSNSVYWAQMGKTNPNRPDEFTSYGKTIYESLAGGNIIPEILDRKENGFANWWANKVETQFIGAWLSYEKKYQEIVADLVSALWRQDDAFFNGSGMKTGVVYALHQERQLALMVLGEILKNTYPNYQELLSPSANKPVQDVSGTSGKNGITRIAVALGDESAPNLFAKIGYNDSLDFDALTAPTLLKLGVSPNAMSRNFNFQNTIWKNFTKLTQVIAKIKPIEIERQGKKYKVTSTTVTNAQIDEALTAVKASIAAAQIMFAKVPEDSFKGKITKQAFRTLERNAEELASYGKIANAVSYVENFKKSEGKPVNMRCQNITKVNLTNAAQRAMQADCEDFELKAADEKQAQVQE